MRELGIRIIVIVIDLLDENNIKICINYINFNILN